MENLKLVATHELIDLLARETALYSKMLSTGASQVDFERCKNRIRDLQSEIVTRKESKDPASSGKS